MIGNQLLTNQVNDDDGVFAVLLILSVVEIGLAQKEGGHVGREDGRVHDENEYDPVPHCLEGRVVEDGVVVDLGVLKFVLWQDIGAEG